MVFLNQHKARASVDRSYDMCGYQVQSRHICLWSFMDDISAVFFLRNLAFNTQVAYLDRLIFWKRYFKS